LLVCTEEVGLHCTTQAKPLLPLPVRLCLALTEPCEMATLFQTCLLRLHVILYPSGHRSQDSDGAVQDAEPRAVQRDPWLHFNGCGAYFLETAQGVLPVLKT